MNYSLLFGHRAQLEKVRNDHKLVENLRTIVEKLNAITTEVIESRCSTHARLLGLTIPTTITMELANGTVTSTSDQKPSVPNSKRQLNPVGAANPNSVSGGSRQPSNSSSSKVMSKSASASTSPAANKSNPQQGKGVAMARSLNSPLNHRPCSSPPIARIMQESMQIQVE